MRGVKEVWRVSGGGGEGRKFGRLVAAIVSPSPVASENTTSTGEKPDEKGDKGTKGQPVGIAVLSADPVVPEDIPGNPPEYHVDNPSNEGADKGEARDEGHEYCPRTVVCSPAEAEKNGKTRETSGCTMRDQRRDRMELLRGGKLTDWVEDESEGQVMDEIGRKPSIAGDPSRQYMWKLSRTGVEEKEEALTCSP